MTRPGDLRTWLCGVVLVAAAGCASVPESPEAGAGSVRSRPPLDLPRFTFAHVANPLMDQGGQDTIVLAAESDLLLVDALNQLHGPAPVDLMMVGGNLVHNTGSGNLDLQLLLRRLRAARFPVRPIVGPRDTRWTQPGAIGRGQLVAAMGGRELPGQELYYHVQVAPRLHFIVLDTTEPGPGQGGHVGSKQLLWLEGVLRGLAPDEAAIVFCHHLLATAWPPELDWRFQEHLLTNATQVRIRLEACPAVKAVCTSTVGFPAVRTLHGVHHISNPALSHYPCAFRRLWVERDQIHLETLPISDPKVETLAVLLVREDRTRAWQHYAFEDADQYLQFLRGHSDHWQLSVTMR